MTPPRRIRALLTVTALAVGLSGCGGADPAATTSPVSSSRPSSTDWSPAPRTVDDLTTLARSDADGFRLFTASGQKTFLPGANLGSTTPLHQPGEIGNITAATYRRWLTGMGAMGVRVVRIYTLPPPAFYAELAAYNHGHADAPLYLVQGVYLPDESYVEPGRTLYTPAVDDGFTAEIDDVEAAVHGDLSRPQQPGRAGGTYDVDVSRWLVGWIIGAELDPHGVARTDRREADHPYSPGRYFAATEDATATERWLAGHLDQLAALEARRGVSVPVAFANWPTDDPLHHPVEPLDSEDLAGIDANHVLPTDAWPGGTFASFHAYPYYPDFQRYEPAYDDTGWRGRPDRYAGYLKALQQHFAPHMPLLVTEFGVPSSLGSAHAGTNGRDQGDHSEQEAMAMDADMMRMMKAQGIPAAFVFEWADEWFKRTWNTQDHQTDDRLQLWHDPLTNEQWFGVVATDPEPIDGARARSSPETGPVAHLGAWADASWVHLDIRTRGVVPDRLTVDADVVPGPQAADYRIVVDHSAGTARLLVRRALDPIRLDNAARPYRPDEAEPWHLYELLTNRAYPGDPHGPRTPHPAEYQPVGELVRGSWDPTAKDYDSLATWHVDTATHTVSLRIPWSMLGMADPSSRTALGEGDPAALVKIPGIGLHVDAGGPGVDLDFTWPTWNYTTYRPRLKAGAGVLREAFTELAP